MRYIRYLFLASVALCLIILALANRGTVQLRLLPEEMTAYLGYAFTYEIPMFMVIFAAIVLGLLIGFVWEWLREHKHRVEARTATREKQKLEREVKGLKRKTSEGRDEVLALLDDAQTS